MSGPADSKPVNEYAPQWIEVRRRQHHFFVGLLLPFAVMILILGAAVVLSYLQASKIVWGILGVTAMIVMIGLCVGQCVLTLRYMWWRCPRCGHPYFGWIHIRDVHWWRIWSCVRCGLLVDAPNAKSCRDRRTSL